MVGNFEVNAGHISFLSEFNLSVGANGHETDILKWNAALARFDATDADYRYSKHHQYCDLTDDLHWVEDVPGDKEEAGNLTLSVHALATAFILIFRCHTHIKSLQNNHLFFLTVAKSFSGKIMDNIQFLTDDLLQRGINHIISFSIKLPIYPIIIANSRL